MGADAFAPLVTGGGALGILLGVIAYLVRQNWKLTSRLSEVQQSAAAVAEEGRKDAERFRREAEERAAQRIAELEALLRLTATGKPVRGGGDEQT